MLAGIDLRIEPGERVLLAGPSGAGKSTLLLALAGLLSPDDGELVGEVTVGGATGLLLQDPTAAVVAERAGRDTAFGPENLAMARDQTWARVREALRDSGFPYGLDRPTSALSGGEGQRLALAGALALRPGLMLLDEPAAMLDEPTARQVRAAVLAVAESTGCTLVVVEHRMTPWLAHVDRLVVLSAGQVSSDGPPSTVLAALDAEAAARLWLPAPPPIAGIPALTPSFPAHAPSFPALVSLSAALGPPEPHSVRQVRGAGRVLVEATGAVAQPGTWRRSQQRNGQRGQGGQSPVQVGPVDVSVRAGAVTALVGPSGAGKSTLLALLAGLSAPVAGTVLADPGWSPRHERRLHRWRSRELAQRVAWVPQLPEHALVARTVRDEVLATARALGQPAPPVDLLLDELGLSGLAGRDPHTLSGGEQRRLGLAAALAHRPQLLLLDEPTVGQDRLTWAAVVGTLLAAVQGGIAVVVASHDVDLLEALPPNATTVTLT